MDVYVGEGRRRVRKSTGTSDKIRAKIIEQSVIAVNRNITSRQRAMLIIDNVRRNGNKASRSWRLRNTTEPAPTTKGRP